MLLPNLANEELARFSIMVFGMSRISLSFFFDLFGVLRNLLCHGGKSYMFFYFHFFLFMSFVYMVATSEVCLHVWNFAIFFMCITRDVQASC